ncbi:hypothetical protein D0T53_10890 [Dysgonomonas sp. 216]|uniref:hypothetical protein n=1 Tax=Dysgonomonas sp. 216 TaxID=2302934 RepID=UPI0013CFF930|nr:hypothetical protein [Dysgonomonas sp. 216]NDW19410.1 hypothetical protein [Dysgonomonas sp. 216]
MAAKRYISKTGVKYSFLVEVNGKVKSISFKGNEKDCIVNDPATQKAVEESKFFKSGWIGVAPGTTAGGFDEDVEGIGGKPEGTEEKLNVPRANSKTKAELEAEAAKGQSGENAATAGGEATGEGVDGEATPYTEVTDINGAVAILKGDPYKVHHMKLKDPASVMEQAKLNSVSFPNWNIQ